MGVSDATILALASATLRRVRSYVDVPDAQYGVVPVEASGPYSDGWEFAAPGVLYEFRGGYRLRPGARRNYSLDCRVTPQGKMGRDAKGEFLRLSWCLNKREALCVIEDFIRGVDPAA